MDITKIYIGLYKLKKCIIWQFKGINITAIIFISLFLCIAIFQQMYYPIVIAQKDKLIKQHLDHLQYTYSNVTDALEDLKTKVEDYNADDWRLHIKEIRLLLDKIDDKSTYYESSIMNYYSASRTKRQKVLF